MSTTVLAYLILFMGFITFLCGAFGLLMLLFEEVSKTERVQFRYYAMVIGLISGGGWSSALAETFNGHRCGRGGGFRGLTFFFGGGASERECKTVFGRMVVCGDYKDQRTQERN